MFFVVAVGIHHPSFQCQEKLFSFQSGAETGERTISADDPVTGDAQRQGIGTGSPTNGPALAYRAQTSGQFAITCRFAIGNFADLTPDRPLKGGALQCQWEGNGSGVTGEIVQKLARSFG